jgi:hypothetical protein
MKKKLDFNVMDIDSEVLDNLNDLKAKQEQGEEIDPRQAEALKAIEIASNVIDSLMSGRQIDLGYFRIYTKQLNSKVTGPTKVRPLSGPLNNRRKKRAKEQDKQ